MEWFFLVKRRLSVLFLELISSGQTGKALKEILGLGKGLDHYRTIENDVYYTVKEIKELQKLVDETYRNEGVSFFRRMLDSWNKFASDLLEYSYTLSLSRFDGVADEKLLDHLEEYREKFYLFASALMMPMRIEKVADDVIRKSLDELFDKDKALDYFNVLTTPDKDSFSTLELKNILRIAAKFKVGKDINDDVKVHISEFGWINTRGFYGDAWSEKEVFLRVKELAGSEPEKKLKELQRIYDDVKARTKNILDEMGADSGFKDFVDITKKYVDFRNYRMDVYVKSGFLARPLFKEIAKRIDVELDDMFNMLISEIKDALLNKVDYSDLLLERRDGFGFFRTGIDVKVLSGNKLLEFKKKELNVFDTDQDHVNGVVANRGYAKGRVVVVADKTEIVKVKEGDILVTSMTTPDFIVAMEKAKAFVTDEGGILCHAAIVSREMKKPCVIGTKVATKVFKDGDIVEVDAEKGVVRKI